MWPEGVCCNSSVRYTRMNSYKKVSFAIYLLFHHFGHLVAKQIFPPALSAVAERTEQALVATVKD